MFSAFGRWAQEAPIDQFRFRRVRVYSTKTRRLVDGRLWRPSTKRTKRPYKTKAKRLVDGRLWRPSTKRIKDCDFSFALILHVGVDPDFDEIKTQPEHFVLDSAKRLQNLTLAFFAMWIHLF